MCDAKLLLDVQQFWINIRIVIVIAIVIRQVYPVIFIPIRKFILSLSFSLPLDKFILSFSLPLSLDKCILVYFIMIS